MVVHANLIFLHFQIFAKQDCYGFTRGDYLELLPGFPGSSGNQGNPTMGDFPARGDLPAKGDLPCRVSASERALLATPFLLIMSDLLTYLPTDLPTAKRFFNLSETRQT